MLLSYSTIYNPRLNSGLFLAFNRDSVNFDKQLIYNDILKPYDKLEHHKNCISGHGWYFAGS